MSAGTLQPPAAQQTPQPLATSEPAWGQPPQAGLPGDWATSAASAVNGGTVDPLADLDGFDTEGVSPGAGRIEMPGVYHMEIADAEQKDETNAFGQPYINLRCVVLNTITGQSPAGSVMWHELAFPTAEDKEKMIPTKTGEVSSWTLAMNALCQFCEAAGLFVTQKGPDGKQRYIDLATGTTKIQGSTLATRLRGCQFIARPEKDEWGGEGTGKAYGFAWRCRHGRGVSRIGDPKNAHIPMHEAALAAAGLKRFQAPAQQTQSQQGVTQQGVVAARPAPVAAAPQQAAPVMPVADGQYDDL